MFLLVLSLSVCIFRTVSVHLSVLYVVLSLSFLCLSLILVLFVVVVVEVVGVEVVGVVDQVVALGAMSIVT